MAGHETRMLLLGAVALFEPVNGYQIRRELMSWQVDSWAHVNPGSIYNGLATLTRQGHLDRHDLRDAGRDVAVYEMTDAGRDELHRLLASSLEIVDLYDAVAFHAAIGMLPLVRRTEAIAHLQKRLAALDDTVEHLARTAREDRGSVPPHALLGLELQLERARSERAWLVEVLDDLRSGDLTFRGEPWTWQAPADDPGWQMNVDREKYRALLGR